jgi:DNA-binding Lrp family transcriptional regulator
VAPAGLDPDALDLAMLREMYRNGAVNLAGIDPRLNASRVARALGIGRARAAARLRSWRESGFLRKYDVWPNPALLGWIGAWTSIRVDHPRVKPDLVRRLGLVEGLVSAVDYQGEWISVGLVGPDRTSLERRAGVLRNLVGVRDVEPIVLWKLPSANRTLSPLDRRIVTALRERPTATLAETARRVGVSTRTMTRKYSDLVDDWSVWFLPVFDFRAIRSPVVSLTLQLGPGASRAEIARRIRAEFPLLLDLTSEAMGAGGAPTAPVFFVVLPSAARIDDLDRHVASLPGVQGVEAFVMIRVYDFPEWFDHQLAGWSETRSRPSSPRASSVRGAVRPPR